MNWGELARLAPEELDEWFRTQYAGTYSAKGCACGGAGLTSLSLCGRHGLKTDSWCSACGGWSTP